VKSGKFNFVRAKKTNLERKNAERCLQLSQWLETWRKY